MLAEPLSLSCCAPNLLSLRTQFLCPAVIASEVAYQKWLRRDISYIVLYHADTDLIFAIWRQNHGCRGWYQSVGGRTVAERSRFWCRSFSNIAMWCQRVRAMPCHHVVPTCFCAMLCPTRVLYWSLVFAWSSQGQQERAW